jgi:alkyl hydroperoxide reductase subunit AhpF
MPLIRDEIAEQLRAEFAHLAGPVQLAVFSQALADPESEQVKRLMEELAALEPRIGVASHNFVLDTEKVQQLGIRRTPGIAIMGKDKDYGVRFYGLPSGYEFGTLIEAILDVGSGQSGLSAPTREALAQVTRPVHLQVFSTPT